MIFSFRDCIKISDQEYQDPFTGQVCRIPKSDKLLPTVSSPSPEYLRALCRCADPNCPKCKDGYQKKNRHVEGGRCFTCIGDNLWEKYLTEAARSLDSKGIPKTYDTILREIHRPTPKERSTEELMELLGIKPKKK